MSLVDLKLAFNFLDFVVIVVFFFNYLFIQLGCIDSALRHTGSLVVACGGLVP